MTSTVGRSEISEAEALLARRIGALLRERARLEEEILQLRAAVHVWTDICRHTVNRASATLAQCVAGRAMDSMGR